MDWITDILSDIEKVAVDVIAVFAPWLGPVPSAYLVGRACINYLDWHWSIALIAAIAVESIGVVSVVLALRLHEWNEAKNKTDPAAPFWLTAVTVSIYFVITIGLTVLLDVIPELARYAPAVFPLLAAVGAVNIAVKNGQQRREEAKQGKRQRRRERRRGRVVTEQKPVTKRADNGYLPGDFRLLSDSQKEQVSALTTSEIADMADVSDSTARRWKRKVSANGTAKE